MRTTTQDEIRTRFCSAMSEIYRAEVPLYDELLRLVRDVDGRGRDADREAPRIAIERHGAIRLGRPDELLLVRRLFAVMGMHPVGYYDLAPSGIPVHSTAFRPTSPSSLAANPFRMFTSLLRLDLVEDAALRREAERILAERRIMTQRAQVLIGVAETDGLDEAGAEELVRESLETFRWNAEASVDRSTYQRFRSAHPLIADVVCFKGPHVNHLTPRVLDIDAVHQAMIDLGMEPKETIEGPPRRANPVLLRQTSFKAREERISFAGELGTHTARFGEVEQRGAALTEKGRALYDRCLARKEAGAFNAIPDDADDLRRQDLIFCRYRATGRRATCRDLEPAIAEGAIEATPITYEDFLPASAAGIFRSNLPGEGATVRRTASARPAFEAALGAGIRDEMALYAEVATRSAREALAAIRP